MEPFDSTVSSLRNNLPNTFRKSKKEVNNRTVYNMKKSNFVISMNSDTNDTMHFDALA